MAYYQDVSNYTNTPKITLFIITLLKHLWCSVETCSYFLIQNFFWSNMNSVSETDKFNTCVLTILKCNQNIFRSYISVNNLLRMNIAKTLQDIMNDIGCISLIKLILLNDNIEEFFTVKSFLDNIYLFFVLACV